MDDLVQWLTTQLDKDERVARDAGGDRWSHHGGSLMWPTERGPRDAVVAHQGSTVGCVAITNPVHGDGAPEALHIAAHDPARVLREVEAGRRLIRAHDKWCEGRCEVKYPEGGFDAAHYWNLKVRAEVYADRPGYREEWRP
ncbi:DUF6221 family protein [Streptomyces bauhiniae]|uniref:Uncharacterized protein n=1 Tax=Streptomyces bauhiniae TaxID=2340725 RepID=A0A7K3QR93_9ACTN|nr:DUF6221 family protein [Streptomyces bauhiniae]NEB92421.1 hypothetical protein [Streptomyces bauhiniae]